MVIPIYVLSIPAHILFSWPYHSEHSYSPPQSPSPPILLSLLSLLPTPPSPSHPPFSSFCSYSSPLPHILPPPLPFYFPSYSPSFSISPSLPFTANSSKFLLHYQCYNKCELIPQLRNLMDFVFKYCFQVDSFNGWVKRNEIIQTNRRNSSNLFK